MKATQFIGYGYYEQLRLVEAAVLIPGIKKVVSRTLGILNSFVGCL